MKRVLVEGFGFWSSADLEIVYSGVGSDLSDLLLASNDERIELDLRKVNGGLVVANQGLADILGWRGTRTDDTYQPLKLIMLVRLDERTWLAVFSGQTNMSVGPNQDWEEGVSGLYLDDPETVQAVLGWVSRRQLTS